MEIVLYAGLSELPHFNPDLDREGQAAPEAVAKLRSQVSASDGLIICSPEYAHGVPGSLKNALDWLVSWPDFAGKPVLLLNASGAGGEWAQRSLVETLTIMSARVSDASLLAPFLRKKLDPGAAQPDAESARLLRERLEAFAAGIRSSRQAR